jgi:hypothetical protein
MNGTNTSHASSALKAPSEVHGCRGLFKVRAVISVNAMTVLLESLNLSLFVGVVISMLCCGPGEIVVANEVLDGTNVMGQLLGEG